jgi:hypothetical protein
MSTLQPLRELIRQSLDQHMTNLGWRKFGKNGYSIEIADGVYGKVYFVYALWPEFGFIRLSAWFGLIFDRVERKVMRLMGRRYRKYQTSSSPRSDLRDIAKRVSYSA